MATKGQRYAQATEQSACQGTDSFEDWTGFLAMAGRLYKYPFVRQLFVYAQWPEAVACAAAALWEQRSGGVSGTGAEVSSLRFPGSPTGRVLSLA